MSRRGLSLVEIIVSLALLAAVLIFVLNLFPTALATLNRVEFNHDLDQRARGLLELYAAQSPADWPVGPARSLPSFEVQNTPVQASLEVQKYADSDPERLVKLRLVLNWNQTGRARTLVRESLVARGQR